MITDALNKKQKKNSRKRKNSSLQLHQGQANNSIGTVFFTVSPGSTPGGVRVRGRELFRSLLSGSTAHVYHGAAVKFDVGSLPRLAAYKPIYEMYLFHSAKFTFQSNQPTTQKGAIGLAIDYDVKDNAVITMAGLMRNISSSISNVYANNSVLMDRRLSRLNRYVNEQDNNPDDSQTKQFTLLYGMEGIPDTQSSIGYLFCEYDVEFFTPQ